jgi:hypothetical protein
MLANGIAPLYTTLNATPLISIVMQTKLQFSSGVGSLFIIFIKTPSARVVAPRHVTSSFTAPAACDQRRASAEIEHLLHRPALWNSRDAISALFALRVMLVFQRVPS